MAIISTKPSMNYGIWGSNGNITVPTSEKVEQGHIVEKPKAEIVNWIENRQDSFLQFINQRGIPTWDSLTEYPEGSYTVRSGTLYKALSQNQDKDPTSNTSIWIIAFTSYESFLDLYNDVQDIMNVDQFLDWYVSKETPVMTGKCIGTGYLASTGLLSTGSEEVGYSFNGKNTDGICHNGSNIVVTVDSTIVAKFDEKQPITDSSTTLATTEWVQELVSSVMDSIVPIGAIVEYTDAVIPSDKFMYAHGQAISRTVYATLFSRIGTKYGAGDGSTTFNLPDKRGLFTREWDNGKGIDSGRSLGSTQLGQVQKHKHIQNLGESYDNAGYFGKSTSRGYFGSNGGIDQDNYLLYTNDGTSFLGNNPNSEFTNNPIGDETRPRNIALVSLIRVK